MKRNEELLINLSDYFIQLFQMNLKFFSIKRRNSKLLFKVIAIYRKGQSVCGQLYPIRKLGELLNIDSPGVVQNEIIAKKM